MKQKHLYWAALAAITPNLPTILNMSAGPSPDVFGANHRPNQRKRRLQWRRQQRPPVR